MIPLNTTFRLFSFTPPVYRSERREIKPQSKIKDSAMNRNKRGREERKERRISNLPQRQQSTCYVTFCIFKTQYMYRPTLILIAVTVRMADNV